MTIEVSISAKAYCAHCGDPVSNRGRRSKTGKRYHSDNPACRAAKYRENYAARVAADRGEVVRWAPSACSNCGCALPERRWRADDGAGRWCDKPNCRASRNRTRSTVYDADKAELLTQIEFLQTVVQFLGEVVMADWDGYLHEQRRHCKICGNMDAIDGWVHPDRERGACMGTLNGMPPRKIGQDGLINAWPGPSRFSDPES